MEPPLILYQRWVELQPHFIPKVGGALPHFIPKVGGALLYSIPEVSGASLYSILEVGGAYFKLYTIYMYKTE